ncbi:MAG: S41 family peptidase [Longimicrobiales bacterium]
MRTSVKLALIGLITVPLLGGVVLLQARQDVQGARLFEEVLSRVAREAVDSAAVAELYEQAARGLIDGIDDPYADLFSPEQLADFSRQTLGNAYGGVGMQIEDQQGAVTVTRVFPDTPAERGGVRAGDRIMAVNGHAVRGWRLDEVSDSLVGQTGTVVAVSFRRPRVQQPIETSFARAVIHVPAVPFALSLAEGIGYVPLQRFNDTAAEEVRDAVARLQGDGARAFIIDLRGNPGGSLEQALRLADLFLGEEQQIASVRYRNQPADVYDAGPGDIAGEAPLVILTDGYSASAAEIVAGALQDHDRALIVGAPTFGKGLVQTMFPLSSGWALKLTTGKWYTPSGRSIQRADTPAHADARAPLPDTRRADRPRFRSAAGRTVYGGGGIVPDLVVLADTLSAAEHALFSALAPAAQASYVALYELGLELKDSVAGDFRVEPAWRASYYERLRRTGVRVDRPLFDAGAPLVDRWIEQRVAGLAFGDSLAFRRGVARDRPLMRALQLLRQARTTQQLFALAARIGGAS